MDQGRGSALVFGYKITRILWQNLNFHQTGLYNNKLNQKLSELMKITHKYVYHAPSYAKYSTCKHLILLTWQLHDLIVECNYMKFKKTSLRDLDITLEKLRSMWSLYYD